MTEDDLDRVWRLLRERLSPVPDRAKKVMFVRREDLRAVLAEAGLLERKPEK